MKRKFTDAELDAARARLARIDSPEAYTIGALQAVAEMVADGMQVSDKVARAQAALAAVVYEVRR